MRVETGADWGETLTTMAAEALEAELRTTGLCVPPRLHVLVDGLELPYVGYMTCRPFYRGNDAVSAVGMMGLFGSMLGASRLVLTWEHADLCMALNLPGADVEPTRLVVLEAHRDGRHVVRERPFQPQRGPDTRDGRPTVVPVWQRPEVLPDAALPNPAGALLAVWRQRDDWTDEDMLGSLARFETGGYGMRWVQRPAGEQGQPRWMELLRPIM